MADMNEFNTKVIAEFRANAGKVGPPFEGSPMVLLTTTGARTGRTLTSPLVYSTDGDNVVIIASKAGAGRANLSTHDVARLRALILHDRVYRRAAHRAHANSGVAL